MEYLNDNAISQPSSELANQGQIISSMPPRNSNRNLKIIIGILVYLFVVSVGAVGFYLYKNKTVNKNKQTILNGDVTTTPEPAKSAQLTRTIIFTKDSFDTHSVFAIIPGINKETLLFTITKPPKQSAYDLEKETPRIQVADNGIIAYTLTEGGTTTLYYWNGKEIKKRYSSQNPFSFSLAPDGKSTVVLETNEYDDLNSEVYNKFEKTSVWEYIVPHQFSLISLEDNSQPQLILNKDVIDQTFDSRSHYNMVDWSWPDRKNPLLQIEANGQLSTKFYGLYFLDLNKKQISNKYPSVDQKFFLDSIYLTTTTDGAYLAYRKPDHACCGGINYGNDQTYVLNLANGSEIKVFDEYERYQNTKEDQAWTEQHETINLYFSPKKYNVAQTINHIKISDEVSEGKSVITTSIIITDIDGKEKLMLDGYTLVGWIDEERIIAARIKHSPKYTYDWEIRDFDSIDLINITNGEESNIYKGVISRPTLIEGINRS